MESVISRGIVKKIPYLKLGVDMVWLNPFYQYTAWLYDVQIIQWSTPVFGDMADFEENGPSGKSTRLTSC